MTVRHHMPRGTGAFNLALLRPLGHGRSMRASVGDSKQRRPGQLDSHEVMLGTGTKPVRKPKVCRRTVVSGRYSVEAGFAKSRQWRQKTRRVNWARLRCSPCRWRNGARGGGRTHNLRLRRPTLYPIELRAQPGPAYERSSLRSMTFSDTMSRPSGAVVVGAQHPEDTQKY
jgi:hypothetical protein